MLCSIKVKVGKANSRVEKNKLVWGETRASKNGELVSPAGDNTLD